MTREELETWLHEKLSAHDDGSVAAPLTVAYDLAPAVAELIEAARAEARAAERQVCVDVAAGMARDALNVRRTQRAAAMSRVAEVLKSGVNR